MILNYLKQEEKLLELRISLYYIALYNGDKVSRSFISFCIFYFIIWNLMPDVFCKFNLQILNCLKIGRQQIEIGYPSHILTNIHACLDIRTNILQNPLTYIYTHIFILIQTLICIYYLFIIFNSKRIIIEYPTNIVKYFCPNIELLKLIRDKSNLNFQISIYNLT